MFLFSKIPLNLNFEGTSNNFLISTFLFHVLTVTLDPKGLEFTGPLGITDRLNSALVGVIQYVLIKVFQFITSKICSKEQISFKPIFDFI